MSILMMSRRWRWAATSISDTTPFEDSSAASLTSLVDELTYLASLAASDGVALSTLATSAGGRTVPMLTIGRGRGRPAILLAGTHAGDEVMPREAALTFARDVIESTAPAVHEFLGRRSLIVIPTLNPDGRSLATRENAAGVDLNRDAVKLTQPETRALLTLVSRRKPIAYYDGHENLGATTQKDVEYQTGMHASMSTSLHSAGVTALTRSIASELTASSVDSRWYAAAPIFGMLHHAVALHGCHTALVETGHQGGGVTDWAQLVTRLDRYGWHRMSMATWFDDVVANASALDISGENGRAETAAVATTGGSWDISGHLGDPSMTAVIGTTVTATGYTMTAAQYVTAQHALAAHGIDVTTDGTTYSVSLAQPSAAAAVYLLDPSATSRLISATRIP